MTAFVPLVLATTVLCSIIQSNDLAYAQASDLPFFFGDSVGDFRTVNNDDLSSIRYDLSTPVLFLGEEYDHFYQNTNGVITFTQPFDKYKALDSFPNSIVPPMVAVYWTDIDTRMGGVAKNQLWARNTTLRIGVDDVAEAAQLVEKSGFDFQPQEVVVMTYNRVNRWDRDESVENTFQMALAYNSDETWIILAYSKLEFYDASSAANMTLVGYNGQQNLTGALIRYLKTEDDMTNLVESSNCGTPGVYVYQVNGVRRGPPITPDEGQSVLEIIVEFITSSDFEENVNTILRFFNDIWGILTEIFSLIFSSR